MNIPDLPMLDSVDTATGLPGYEACLARLDQCLAAADPASVALVDVDWFGKFNQDYGSAAGDALIVRLARALTEALSDTAAIYRYGGDAFMVVFPGTDKEQAFLRMESMRAGFRSVKIAAEGGQPAEPEVSLSCGVAAHPDDASDTAGLIRKCSEALYRAKVRGRGRVSLAREEKMVTKTSHYTQGQLEGLTRLARRESLNESVLLREGLDDLLRKYNS
jgi:diguanylate cyclase (GGDEF)-like protein